MYVYDNANCKRALTIGTGCGKVGASIETIARIVIEAKIPAKRLEKIRPNSS
jgi:hypothetical protein